MMQSKLKPFYQLTMTLISGMMKLFLDLGKKRFMIVVFTLLTFENWKQSLARAA